MNDNQLQIKDDETPIIQATNAFTQSGPDSVQVLNQGKFVNNETNLIVAGTANDARALSNVLNSRMNTHYYNLFVLDKGFEFTSNCFELKYDQSLTSFTSIEVQQTFLPLTIDIVEQIKTFPSIITTENLSFGETTDDHWAKYGLITKIREFDGGYRFSFTEFEHTPIQQQFLNHHLEVLGILGNEYKHELNRTHWSIKQVDLIAEMRKLNKVLVSL
ncbi:hypothetical protein ACODGR_01845 [Vagococcus fluvialis]|uniref:Uncharacterized protein n=1 Tax=Streptococcus dysgalactiae subsp. dysgalactiae TaxID=99822 RepID=A0A9X7X9A2_STRDY|nr:MULTISPECIES: hypothetical protein [Lactobacillales]QGH02311.1 hypothetical protein EA457_07045 [Streptococcus dysgalactiae subsp. dysgalactiae]